MKEDFALARERVQAVDEREVDRKAFALERRQDAVGKVFAQVDHVAEAGFLEVARM